MNKKCILLSGLLLLVPACRKNPRYAPAPIVPATATDMTPGEKAEYDEELGAFVVKEDENKFSAAAAAQAQQEEELTAASSEPTAGDLHNDSAQYGLKTIFFEFDKFKIESLRPDQRPVLEHDLKTVKSLTCKGYRIVLEGHTDSAGSTDYNMALSIDRADAVKQYLKEHGVTGQIDSVGRGSAHLVVPASADKSNLAELARQEAPNRRVEIYAYADSQENA